MLLTDGNVKNCTVNLKWIHLETVTSTNSYLQARIHQGTGPEEMLVIADFQEHGRGQGENGWVSDKAQNLLMSMLLYPEFLSASRQFQLTIATSLAVCDTLQELEVTPSIKWPNDILTATGKMAGILIENGILGKEISHSIIGIGLNVNQVSFPRFPVPATSLAKEKPGRYDPVSLAGILEKNFTTRYDQLKSGMEGSLKEVYLNRLLGLDQHVRCSSAGADFTGIIRGINEFGELLVEKEGKLRAYGMHTIRFAL